MARYKIYKRRGGITQNQRDLAQKMKYIKQSYFYL